MRWLLAAVVTWAALASPAWAQEGRDANDQYFAPELSRRMHEAYTASGGRASHQLLPAIGNDGRQLISLKSGVPLWQDKVEAFLREIGVLPSR